MDILYKMGQNIRHFRKLMGLTQEDLGNRMGYTRSAIAKIETGKIDIPNSKLLQFAAVLNCTPADLMDYETESQLDEDEMKLISAYRKLSKEERERRAKVLMRYFTILSDDGFKKLEERAEELVELSKLKKEKEE